MIVVGGGPVGAELGQAFQRLGTQVTFVMRNDKFLPKEDIDAASHVVFQLQQDGCHFEAGSEMLQIDLIEPGDKANGILPTMAMNIKQIDTMKTLEFDTILFATGR